MPLPEEQTIVADIAFGPDILRNPDSALRREWLVTNGLGGYASASLTTANTRRYHGLLVAALVPPVGRAVLLSKLEETLRVANADHTTTNYALATNVYPGAMYPRGYEALQSWSAWPCPTWQWTPAPGVTLEKRVWMAQGQNTTYIAYRLVASPDDAPALLSLVPLLAWRDYHSEMAACAFHPATAWIHASLTLILPPIQRVTSAPTTLNLHVLKENGEPCDTVGFEANPDWYRHFQHPREQERGLDYQEDLYTPGTLSALLAAGETVFVVATTEDQPPTPQEAWAALLSRQAELIQGKTEDERREAGEEASGQWAAVSGQQQSTIHNPEHLNTQTPEHPTPNTFLQQLILAADQFVVRVPGGRATVIAGYPWFGDWGRDTMIALPGLCLASARREFAREILLSFAAYVDRGMLPNRFPDFGAAPEYNTVDATLWYFAAIYRYVAATSDVDMLAENLWDVLKEIIRYHRQGTRYNIHVDSEDHLLYAGQSGVQLTWMDAKVGDWVVTPRIGKPVEINALWHNALRIMAYFAGLLNDSESETYTQQADATQTSFVRRFARPDGLGLYDVLDTPGEGSSNDASSSFTLPPSSLDLSIRPNQIFALSLPFAPVEPNTPLAQSVLSVVREELLTPYGLRTLSPRDSAFQPRYEGDPRQRDGAYHQGTVWPWLLGPFAEAHAKVTGDTEGAKALLSGLQTQLTTGGIGSLAEIFDGTDPQRPNGCFAQAWSVAETLRVWKWLTI